MSSDFKKCELPTNNSTRNSTIIGNNTVIINNNTVINQNNSTTNNQTNNTVNNQNTTSAICGDAITATNIE